jgi:hypothetical protein
MMNLNNFNSSVMLLLLMTLISIIFAMPQDPYNNIPSRTLTAQLSKRTGAQEAGVHLPPGAVAGIVVIVIISIFLCCPCWKWILRNRNNAALKTLPAQEVQLLLDGRQRVGNVMQELAVPQQARQRELHGEDAPPSYEEVGRDVRRAVERGTPEPDSKGTVLRSTNEMSGSGMEHEINSG